MRNRIAIKTTRVLTDRSGARRRPALVLTSSEFNQKSEHSVLTMITSVGQSSWPGNHLVNDLDAAGLPAGCVVRLKLLTLDHRLVIRTAGDIGQIAQRDDEFAELLWCCSHPSLPQKGKE